MKDLKTTLIFLDLGNLYSEERTQIYLDLGYLYSEKKMICHDLGVCIV